MIWAAFTTSLRLVRRSPWIWAVTLLLLPLIGLLTRYEPGGTGLVLSLFHQPLIFPVFLLGQMLAVVSEAQREKARGAAEQMEALPYRTAALMAGRVGGIYAAWLVAGTLLYLAGVVLAVLVKGEWPSVLLLTDWFLLVPVTLLFTTGVAFAVGTLLRWGFASYLVTLVLFLAGSMPFNQGFSLLFQELLGAGPLATIDFSLSSYFPFSSQLAFPNAWPLLFNRLHAAGAGLTMMSFVVWRAARRRQEPARWPGVAALASLLVVLIAFTGGRAAWAMRVGQMMAEEAYYGQGVTGSNSGVLAPQVLGYKVWLNLGAGREQHRLEAVAEVELREPPATAVFTLNHNLRVRQVQGPDGQELPFTQNGDLVLLVTGSRSGTYRFDYSGWVWQWRMDMRGGLRMAAHVTEQSVMLPTSLGWYPLPGAQTLAVSSERNPGITDEAVWHPPVPLDLQVDGLTGLHLATNAGSGRPVTAAWLIGTPWAPADEETFRSYLSPMSRTGAEGFSARYRDELAFYQRLVPLESPLQMIEVADALWAVQTNDPVKGFPGAMVISTGFVGELDNMRAHQQMLHWWWHNARTAEEAQVHDVLTLFMAELYQKAERGMTRAYITMPFGRTLGTDTAEGKDALKQLHQLYDQQGLPATGELLRSLHGTTEPLTWQRVGAALRGHGL